MLKYFQPYEYTNWYLDIIDKYIDNKILISNLIDFLA